MDNYILPLLQICDSNFPIGSFSHSFGLETYIQEDLVKDKDTFLKWMEVYIQEQLVYTDGIACRLAYEALEEKRIEELWRLDHMMSAQILAKESREASRKIGERLLTLGNQLYSSLFLSYYMDQVKARKCYGHPAIVFAMIAYGLNIQKSTAVLTYLFSSVTSIIQNAVRGIPLGQTDGQQLIKESQSLIIKSWDIIEKLTEEDFGVMPPGLEISQMRHERLHVRIFMS